MTEKIEDYQVVSNTIDQFNRDVKVLIEAGYEVFDDLQITELDVSNGINKLIYTQSFIKYLKT